MHVNRSALLSTLARRYRQAEDAGFRHLFLAIVLGASGLGTGSAVLLAFVPTGAVLVLAFVLTATAVLAVVATVGAMVGTEDPVQASDHAPVASEEARRPLRSPAGRLARRRAHSREAPLPR